MSCSQRDGIDEFRAKQAAKRKAEQEKLEAEIATVTARGPLAEAAKSTVDIAALEIERRYQNVAWHPVEVELRKQFLEIRRKRRIVEELYKMVMPALEEEEHQLYLRCAHTKRPETKQGHGPVVTDWISEQCLVCGYHVAG